MAILETLGSFLADAATRLHIKVLSDNDSSNSSTDVKKVKITEKGRSKSVDKSKRKSIDKSTHVDNSV
ncbi:MAG TPA: hypothetical protein VFT87_02830, partial [Candidatus Saccharimonadales bacterium]|nr:hypothetical protein [Candidatus Saccharimonadales bacterium]